MVQPLDGIRVVDLTRLFPGPMATAWLSDYGADVIKVEEPGKGDYSRFTRPYYRTQSAYFLNVNRNKRSIGLDLRTEAGQKILDQLVSRADVFVATFRPGAAERLGADYATLSKRYPRLIYLSVTGYGHSGPYTNMAGHDLNIAGIGGGLHHAIRDNFQPFRPEVPSVSIADVSGAIMSVVGVLLALRARDLTGQGQFIDLALVDTMVSLLPVASTTFFATGKMRAPDEMKPRLGEFPRYNIYQTKDGKWVTFACLEKKFWVSFCRTVGREDLVNPNETWEDRTAAKPDLQEYLIKELRVIFLTRTQAEWVRDMTAVDVPCLPANDISGVFSDPQVLAREMLVEMDHPTEGTIKNIGLPVKLSKTPGSIKRYAPFLGEHTRAVLGELGYSQAEIEALLASKVVGERAMAGSTPVGSDR